MENSNDNRLRSINHLAVIDGWFKPEDDVENRYSLHLTASFRPERLGGVADSKVHFRIRLRQCEIVVMLPENGHGFEVDLSTVDRSTPNSSVRVTDTSHLSAGAELNAEFGINSTGFKADATAKAGMKANRTRDVEHTQLIQPLNTQFSTTDGHRSWIVTSPVRVLTGTLWNADQEPRFTMIDQRSPATIQFERERNLSPNAIVQVRCKREDVDIFDIQFKDPDTERWKLSRAKQTNRDRAAEAFLKSEIQRQRLHVGDIQDKFSDMTLAEYVVPLFT